MAEPAPTPDPPEFTVERSNHDGFVALALIGELDIGSVGRFETVLDGVVEDADARVLVDLSALRFIDSTGLAALIRAHTATTGAGGRLVVVALPGAVRRTFATTGLDALLAFFERRAEAERSLRV